MRSTALRGMHAPGLSHSNGVVSNEPCLWVVRLTLFPVRGEPRRTTPPVLEHRNLGQASLVLPFGPAQGKLRSRRTVVHAVAIRMRLPGALADGSARGCDGGGVHQHL